MTSPHTPVLIGVAQVLQRLENYDERENPAVREPLELMIEALEQAADDAGCPNLLGQADSVRVVRGIWWYANPAKAVAEALACPTAHTGLTPYGGNCVQQLVNRSALDIQQGRNKIVLITGAECGKSMAAARKQGRKLNWRQTPGEPDTLYDQEKPMSSDFENEIGLRAPVQWYPIFETALRAQHRETPEEHLKRISELWAGFSAVAAKNPYAWLQQQYSAEEIRTVSATNRPISFPYPKLMNSNSSVDMGAALIMTNVETARQLGIEEAKWVYPHAGTDAHDTYFVSDRDELHSSPAIRIAGQRVLELTGLTPSEVDHVDIYSCFPVAVQVGAREIGFDLNRPLTVTGGLTFNGGPLNNYVMHSIARMAEILRDESGSKGLITANGGMLTKHSFGVYSTTPPEQPFQHQDVQQEVDALPTRSVDPHFLGEVTIEGYNVMYGAQGPDVAYVGGINSEGMRTWSIVRDPDTLIAMTQEEFVGRKARRDAEHQLAVL